jgi:hypothetical protein
MLPGLQAVAAGLVTGLCCGMAMASGVNVNASLVTLTICCTLASFMR